jgi:uncharacterized protein
MTTTSPSAPEYPGIVLTPECELFWESVQRKAMRLPRCADCSTFFFPPFPMCQNCWSTNITWELVSGRGKIFSYVVYQRLYNRAFESLLPYVVAVIELSEGPRLLSRLHGVQDVDALSCDQLVTLEYVDQEGQTLPLFVTSEVG